MYLPQLDLQELGNVVAQLLLELSHTAPFSQRVGTEEHAHLDGLGHSQLYARHKTKQRTFGFSIVTK